MGIINPRPAMRGAEERRLKNTLQKHQELRVMIREAGVPDAQASAIAFDIVTTSKSRKAIWRAQ